MRFPEKTHLFMYRQSKSFGIVFDGAQLPPPGKGHSSPLSLTHVDCGQTVAHLSYYWALVI